MLYLSCAMICSVDLAHHRVSCAKYWVSVDCGAKCYIVSTLEPRYNTVRYNMNSDITRMRIGPQFLPNLPFSYLLNGSMFSKRVNTVIKMVNYFTFTLTLPCLITQYFAIDRQLKLIIHFLTLRYMYITMTRVKYPRFGRPD